MISINHFIYCARIMRVQFASNLRCASSKFLVVKDWYLWHSMRSFDYVGILLSQAIKSLHAFGAILHSILINSLQFFSVICFFLMLSGALCWVNALGTSKVITSQFSFVSMTYLSNKLLVPTKWLLTSLGTVTISSFTFDCIVRFCTKNARDSITLFL